MGAKTIVQASAAGTASTANTTQYWNIVGDVKVNSSANKANSELKFRSAGDLSNLLVKLSANSVGTTGCVFTLHKNGSNVTQTLSIGASATGDFEDTTHTDAVADADRFCLETDPIPTTGTFTIKLISLLFKATTNTVTIVGNTTAISFTTASTNRFVALHGGGGDSATEALVEGRMRVAGTLKKLGVYVSANRATATAIGLRKENATDGSTFNVTAGGAAGWYEDTSTTHTTTVGTEDWNYIYTTGTGADTITFQTLKTEFETTDGSGICVVHKAGGIAVTDATTRFFFIAGRLEANTTETGATGCQTKAREAFTFDELTCTISQNDVSSASTLTLRKGAADTTMVVSITGSTTGVFIDSAHPQTVVSTDQMSLEATVPSVSGAHTVTFRTITMQTNAAAGTDYTRTIDTETVSVSESVARLLGAIRTESETTNSSESTARVLTAFRTIGTETTSISDSVARSRGQYRTPSETVTLSESISRMLAATRNPQETTVSSETLTRMLAANRSLSDTTAVSDSVVRIRGINRALATETVTINDSVQRMLAANRSLSETTTIGESLTRLLAVTRIINENTTVSDSVSRVFGAVRALSETTNISDSVTRMLAATRTIATETTTINDSLTRMLAATRVISETTVITDSVAALYTPGGGGPTDYVRTITEDVLLSESISRMLAANRALATEATAISENLQRSVGRNRSLTENIVSSESLARLLAATRALSDTTVISDSITRLLAATRTITENTVISDSVTRVKTIIRTLTENVISSDSISRLLAATRQISDTVLQSDSVLRLLTLSRSLSDTTAISDSVVRLITRVRSLIEDTTIIDSVTRRFVGTRPITEDTTISDSISTLFTPAIPVIITFFTGAGAGGRRLKRLLRRSFILKHRNFKL